MGKPTKQPAKKPERKETIETNIGAAKPKKTAPNNSKKP